METSCTTRTGCRVIVDASALIAILRNEPEAEAFAQAIDASPRCRISAANFLEAAIVVDRSRSPIPARRLDDLLRETGIAITPVTEAQARIAREAYRDYGRGSGHPARLNFGDCFAYALARETGEPLLFKGDDFAHTDVAPALKRG
jgi:ribonuclease VapC